MDECPWESEDDSGDDEWFYNSLTRYEHLLMYSLAVSAQCISISEDGQLICLGGTRQNSANELLVYSIPAKLNTTCPLKEGLSSNRDFKLRAGTFTDSPVKQASFYGTNKERLYSTSEGETGLRLWQLEQEDDLITSKAWLKSSSIVSPIYCVAGGKCYLAGSSKVEQVDLGSSSKVEQVDLESWTIASSVAINDNVVGVHCDEEDKVWWCDCAGIIGAQDWRISNKTVSQIDLTSYQDVNPQDWACTFLPNSSLKLAAVGSQGKLCVLDPRSPKRLLLNEHLSFNSSMPLTPPSIYGSPMKDELVTTSADVVNVYDIRGGKLNLLFEHDGHKKRKKVSVLSSAWHTVIDNLLFSTDSHQNLHAWSFPAPK